MKTLIKTTAFILISLFLFSCEKDDGDIGPKGEQGEIGPRGETGPKGDQGESGIPNIIYSDWVNTGFSENISTGQASFTFDAPEINASILNSATILVYGRDFSGISGNIVIQLPVSIGFGNSKNSFFFTASSGKIRITINSDFAIGNSGKDTFAQYRYVIIPQ